MSTNQGNPVVETEPVVGGTQTKQTVQTPIDSGATKSQTVTAEEFQEFKTKFDTLLKESSAKDKKITELQKATESKKDETVTLKSLQEQLQQERTARVRSEFARKNNVSDQALSYLQGSTEEELLSGWGNLAGFIKGEVDRTLQANHQKLSSIPATPSPQAQADLIKEIFESGK